MPAPIRRLDAHLDEEKRRAVEERRQVQMRESAEREVAHQEWLASPEGIADTQAKSAKVERNRIEFVKREKENMRQRRKGHVRRSANNTTAKFRYAERVIIANPIEGSHNRDELEYMSMRGRVKYIGGCKGVHQISKQCYYIVFPIKGSGHMHVEECELRKAQ